MAGSFPETISPALSLLLQILISLVHLWGELCAVMIYQRMANQHKMIYLCLDSCVPKDTWVDIFHKTFHVELDILWRILCYCLLNADIILWLVPCLHLNIYAFCIHKGLDFPNIPTLWVLLFFSHFYTCENWDQGWLTLIKEVVSRGVGERLSALIQSSAPSYKLNCFWKVVLCYGVCRISFDLPYLDPRDSNLVYQVWQQAPFPAVPSCWS